MHKYIKLIQTLSTNQPTNQSTSHQSNLSIFLSIYFHIHISFTLYSYISINLSSLNEYRLLESLLAYISC